MRWTPFRRHGHRPSPFARPRLEPLEDRLAPAKLIDGFREFQVATGISVPTTMEFAPDGRLFVAEQTGALRVIDNGKLLATPVLTVDCDTNSERGLLGVTFDPAFAQNHYLYVYYTAKTPTLHNRISRFTLQGNTAVPGSEVDLFDLDDLQSAIHNAGAIHFGLDGKLYIDAGENFRSTLAQSTASLLGKMLRINPDGTIPGDNPFYNTLSGKYRAIYALGFRNPFTFDVQPGTGRIFVNDVGKDTWEEIDDVVAGGNYGWPDTEGATTDPRFHGPLYTYLHGPGAMQGNAITGGAFYSPQTPQFPSAYVGKYFFADYVNGWIHVLDPATKQVTGFATSIVAPVDVTVGLDGELYYLARGTGSIFRVEASNNPAPAVAQGPADQLISAGQPVTFTVRASGAAPLSYQWQRDGQDIPGATAATYKFTTSAADDGAHFRAVVTNAAGSATSLAATLRVVDDLPPVASFLTPEVGTTYAGGDVIFFAATATDPEDGTLPPSAFTWEVVFHHEDHTHPFLAAFSGVSSGSFNIPTVGETSPGVWYRIHLTVTDSAGLTDSIYRDIYPRLSTFTLRTLPSGLPLRLDGNPVTTPVTVTGVQGIQRTVTADATQTKAGINYAFSAWSDGGDATHTLATPTTPTTFTAIYQGPSHNLLFVSGTYHDVLGRSADDQGLSAFVPALDDARRGLFLPIVTALLSGNEYLTGLVQGIYQSTLNRASATPESAPLVAQLQQGATAEQLISQFLGSTEYYKNNGEDVDPWIFAVYRYVLGREPDPDGLAHFRDQLRKAGRSRTSVAFEFLQCLEYRQRMAQRYYQEFLNRTPSPVEVAVWSGQLGPLTDQQVIVQFLNSNEYLAQHSANVEVWLQGVFDDLLGRAPTSAELDAILSRFLAGYAGARRATAAALISSGEHRTDVVTDFYLKYLGRTASADEVAGWAARLAAGWTDEQVAAQFLGSDEYYQKADGSNLAWLQSLYHDLLGRDLDPTGQSAFLKLLTLRVSRVNVAYLVLTGLEYRQRLVAQDYQSLLGRSASANEIAGWVAGLQGGMTDEMLLQEFLVSKEYFLLPHPYP